MVYLFHIVLVLPCLTGGLFLSMRDWRERKVSRLTVLSLFAFQVAWAALVCVIAQADMKLYGHRALLCVLVTALVFTSLHLMSHANVKRNSLGYAGFGRGDVTAGTLLSLIFTPCEHTLFVLSMWWFLASVSALIFTRIRKEPSIAFVPFLYGSALVTFCMALLA